MKNNDIKNNFLKRLYSASKVEDFWFRWATTPTSIDSIILEDQWALVARSREQYANNDYVRRYVELCKTNIIGADGISVQSTIKGTQGTSDPLAQSAIEKYWETFSEGVDPSNTISRSDFEQSIIQSCIIDGEAFVALRKIDGKTKFSLLDPAQCPVDYNDQAKFIRAGIKYTDLTMEVPVSYFFRMGNLVNSGYRTGDLIELSAFECWHIFKREWVGQKRGIPWIATSLGRLRTLEGYENAALVNARIGTTKMGFLSRKSGDMEYTGELNQDGNIISNTEPGSFEILPDGYELMSWSPEYPHQQYGDFVSATLKGISVGLGISHHSLTGDMSQVNYTSSRTALLDERDMWRRLQSWMINQFTKKLYRTVIEEGVKYNYIKIGNAPLTRNASEYLDATYQGRRWNWVDPRNEVEAAEKAIALGIKSRSSVIRDSGSDPTTVWTEIERERKEMEAHKIILPDMVNTQTQAQPVIPTQVNEVLPIT